MEFLLDKVFRPTLSRIDKFTKRNDLFQQEIDKVGTLPNKGANLVSVENSSKTALEFLREEGNRGTVLMVENYSGLMLADPRSWVRCGFVHDNFPIFETLQPASKDLVILHNNGGLRSSCGSISWQVMDHASKPRKTPGGKGIRMYVTWSNLDAVRGNKCKDGKRNEFSVGFMEVDLDSSDHWDEGSKKTVYKTYHKKEVMNQHNFEMERSIFFNNTGTSLASLIESPDSVLELRAEMGTGCTTTLNIQLLGRRKAKIEESDLGLKEAKQSDEVWEQMIRQAWLDIVGAINRDRALYGIGLEPLHIDPLMQEPIYVNTSMLGYEVEFFMWNITVAGLADLKLDELVLERGESLKNLNTRAVLNIGNLSVTGLYKYKAVYTGWVWGMSDMDSEGDQHFAVDMQGAKLQVEIGMDAVDGCNKTGDVVFTKIAFPILYDEINFQFDNLGTVLDSAISIIGEMALDLSKGMLVDVVKDQLKAEVDTLLCETGQKTPALLQRRPLNPDPKQDEAWWKVLEKETKGWGIDTLRRDILAEQFVTKIFKDGVARHLADPSDPIVKLLDPFQMLAVDEDFRQPGLVKGHVVVCDFWLYGLKNLKLLDMKLARNEDLTYSALKVKLGLNSTRIAGTYRMNNVRVMSVVPAPKSEGTMDIGLTGVTVDLTVVLRAQPIKTQGNASIAMELFEVEFGKDSVKFNITGLAKGMNTVTNKVSNALGNKILNMQKAVLNQEIKNILFGVADCLMYKPAMGMTKCLDAFWESLGFKVPFEFPSCQELYNKADKKLGLISK